MKHPKCYSNGPKSGLNHFNCIHIYPKASARSIWDFELAEGMSAYVRRVRLFTIQMFIQFNLLNHSVREYERKSLSIKYRRRLVYNSMERWVYDNVTFIALSYLAIYSSSHN